MRPRKVRKRCSVAHCDSVDSTVDVSLHRFPPDFDRCKSWVQFCRNIGLDNKAPWQLRDRRVCSRHFSPSAYEQSGRLRRDAVPTQGSVEDASNERSSHMDASPSSLSLTSSLHQNGESGAMLSEAVAKGCMQSQQSQSLQLIIEDAGTQCSSLSQVRTHSTAVAVDHTYAQTSTSSAQANMAGELAALPLCAASPPEPSRCSSSLSCEGSFTSPTNVRRPLDKLSAKLRQLRDRKKRLQGQLLQRRRVKTAVEVVETLREHVTPAVAALVEAQLKMNNTSRFGRRWGSQNKAFALGLYFRSPKGYRYCRQLLKLPSIRSLQLWLSRIPWRVGFYPEVFDLIKRRVASFPQKDRACTIIFYEMRVAKELSYNPVSDRFEGLEEYCTAQGRNLANKALVFMAKGICTPWKQPLGYFFVEKAAPASVLRSLLFQCYDLLVSAGLQPVAVVCRQGNQNASLFSNLVTPQNPYLRISGEPLFFIFDAPHLLKCLRNVFFKYDFRIGSDTIKSSYIRQAYERDREMQIRSIPKLSDRHFNLTFASKMSVKLAAQVFSNHCAAALCTLVAFQQLPAEAIHTARFVERIDRLFDSLNVSQKYGKSPYASAMCAGSVHKEFLEDCIAVFENIEVLGCARQPPCIRGFCQTVRSLLMLWNHLAYRYGLAYLLTRHLNQGVLENTFACVKSKSGVDGNSSCRQFQAAFRHLLVGHLFKLSESSDWAEDMSTLLATVPVSFSTPASSLCTATASLPLVVEVSPNDYPSALAENNIVYFAGWLASKFMNGHRCATGSHKCELRQENAVFSSQSQLLLYLTVKKPGEGDFGSPSVPVPSFVSFINACEEVFVASTCDIVGKEHVGHGLCVLFHTKVEKSLTVCADDVYDSLFALFIRVRLHWFTRRRNAELHNEATKRKATKQARR